MKKNTNFIPYYLGGLALVVVIAIATIWGQGQNYSGMLRSASAPTAIIPTVNAPLTVNTKTRTASTGTTSTGTSAPTNAISDKDLCKANFRFTLPALQGSEIIQGNTYNYLFQYAISDQVYLAKCKPYITYEFINKNSDDVKSYIYSYDSTQNQLVPNLPNYDATQSLLQYFMADGYDRLLINTFHPYGAHTTPGVFAGMGSTLNVYNADNSIKSYSLVAKIDQQIISSTDFTVKLPQ